jgi:hypothetical protein
MQSPTSCGLLKGAATKPCIAKPWGWRLVAILSAIAMTIVSLPARAADASAVVGVPIVVAAPAQAGIIDDSWSPAARLDLAYDYTYRRAAEEGTTVYVAQGAGSLYLAFAVTQRAQLTAAQETNSSTVLSDDYVGVYLYPNGSQGIAYGFFANPRGARYQTSAENTAYTPQWTAVGRKNSTGYVLTMRIPLDVIRSNGSTSWKAQFVRSTVATNGLSVWTFSPQELSASDPTYAGTLTGVGVDSDKKAGSSRPKPRFGAYGLGEITPPSNGGSTSRVGMDFAIPFTPTASFVGTLHPDYSNVEIDQQTIAPSAFARQYAEVRPFFTQTASYFNQHFSCSNCPQSLYTPEIPTFGQAYGVEGTQGLFSFAAYDAFGTDRTDGAQTINYAYQDHDTIALLNFQHVGVSTTGLNDQTSTLNAGYDDQKLHLFTYFNSGIDRGTNVTDAAIGNYFEAGLGYLDATTVAVINLQDVGAQYNPVDGYVAQPDIYGYDISGSKTLNFSPRAALHDLVVSGFFARYNNRFDQLAQTIAAENVNFDFKNLVGVHLAAGSQGVRLFDGEYLPFQNNSILVGYRLNTATPTYVSFTGGKYYHGSLGAWVYLATLPVMPKVHLSLETDEDQYLTDWPGETVGRQWLERAGLDWQFSQQGSFDIGARRIIGLNLPNAVNPLVYGDASVCGANPYNPGCYVNAANVTIAFHFLTAQNEFYVVYGDANNLSTEPALFLKWIRYIGAQKGT